MLRYLAELYRYRGLLFRLAGKDVRVRYKSALLGWLWSLIVPLSISAIFFVIFTYVAPVPKTGVPFFLFLLAAVFPWMFFANSVSHATMCVLESGALIKKHRFPRAVIPLAVVMSQVTNFCAGLVIVIGVVLVHGMPLTLWMGLLPVAVGLELLLTAGVALCVSLLQVHYRDVKYVVELSLLLGFYLTPIFYPVALVGGSPPWVQAAYLANPMVHIVELFRLSLLGAAAGPAVLPPLATAAAAAVTATGFFAAGISLFTRHEGTLADWVLG